MTDTGSPSVAESWRRIDAWLAEYAPATFVLLNPPASAGDVRRAEEAIGFGLPVEVAASLAAHDGMSAWGLPLPMAEPLSAGGIAERRRIWTGEHDPDDHDPDDAEEPWWDPRWIPFAETPSGDLRVIDLRPGAGRGRVGTAVHDDRAHFAAEASGLAGYLGAVADAYRDGGEVDGMTPHVVADGTVGWRRRAAATS